MKKSLVLGGVALIVAGLLLVEAPPALRSAAGAAPSGGGCGAAVRDRVLRQRVYAAPRWRIRCVSSIDRPGFRGAAGLTDAGRREILVVRSTAHPRRVLAHELGHAFSWDKMSGSARGRFARLVGRREFYAGGAWASNPAEIWANNQARCAGYANLVPTRHVSCRTIRTYVRAARR